MLLVGSYLLNNLHMTTAVVRPAHRRQTLDVTAMPPALLGGVTSTVTLDGRLLNDSQQRGRKEEDGRGPTRHQVKGAVVSYARKVIAVKTSHMQ